MIAYKLLTKRKDGTLGPLFINRKQRIPIGKWLKAENHPTKGYKERQGWHCCAEPKAPHLTNKGRVWCRVFIQNFTSFNRPLSQGRWWFIAQRMMVLHEAS